MKKTRLSNPSAAAGWLNLLNGPARTNISVENYNLLQPVLGWQFHLVEETIYCSLFVCRCCRCCCCVQCWPHRLLVRPDSSALANKRPQQLGAAQECQRVHISHADVWPFWPLAGRCIWSQNRKRKALSLETCFAYLTSFHKASINPTFFFF